MIQGNETDLDGHLVLLLQWASSPSQPQVSSEATFLIGLVYICWASGFCSQVTIRMDDTITLLLLNGVQSTFLLPTTFKGKKRDPLAASSGTSCDGELSCTQYQRA